RRASAAHAGSRARGGRRDRFRSVLREVALLLECVVSRGVGGPFGPADGQIRLCQYRAERAREDIVSLESVERLLLCRREAEAAAPDALVLRDRRRIHLDRLRRLEAALQAVQA